MKKVILAISALLTAGVVSAQSYPKQPDKTIVNYTSNYKGSADVKRNETMMSAVNEITGQETVQDIENKKPADKNVKHAAASNNDSRNKLASNTNKKQK